MRKWINMPYIWACNQNKIEVVKKVKIKRLEITYHWRSKKNLWGRFGGGWNWNIGIQISGRTMIINVLIFSLRFYRGKRNENRSY